MKTDNLRRLADAATPGPWFWNSYGAIFGSPPVEVDGEPEYPVVLYLPCDHGDTARPQGQRDARYLERLDPDTVRALLDVVDAAAEFVMPATDVYWASAELAGRAARQLDDLRAALDKWEAG